MRETFEKPSLQDLSDWFAQGEKSPDKFRIGTEHEKFVFYRKTLQPVPYEGETGIGALLQALQQETGWQADTNQEDQIIGLTCQATGASISLEPGGQFELSGAPLETLHQTCEEVSRHLGSIKPVAEKLGIGFLGVGAAPEWPLEAVPLMPKERYRYMRAYMPTVGRHGRDMMFRTTTIQVNLDYASEEDMVRKMQVSLALQPVATALFASSPFLEGKPNGFLSNRAAFWLDTDHARTGLPVGAISEGFGYDAYRDWALDIPLYFIKREGRFHDPKGKTFRQFLDEGIEGDYPDLDDWELHLSTLFPDVRLKRFLEMRGADGGPWARICALPAFWVGLLYDAQSLSAAFDLIKDWTKDEVKQLRASVPETGLETPFRRETLRTVAEQTLEIARQGLKARGNVNESGRDESHFLDTLFEIIASGRTMSDEMLRRYHGPWHQDLSKAYQDYLY